MPEIPKSSHMKKIKPRKTTEERSEIERRKNIEKAKRGKAIWQILVAKSSKERSEIARKREAAKSPEEKSEIGRKAWAGITPEQRTMIARRGWIKKTSIERSALGVKKWAGITPEQRTMIARKGWATKKRVSEVLSWVTVKVNQDKVIRNKKLFVKVANDILNGNLARDIAERYNISELAVIGARRRLTTYFKFSISTQKEDIRIKSLLAKTRFWDTFTEKWANQNLWPYIIYNKQGQINYAEEVTKALVSAFK
ncbi:MAG: hypothetical protein COT14_03210 [Candidatus Diapherotrites archaeon CG08_land_8_20_14_0_20_30_16]|nr:MAG: hypothetical protein COT14_03210 [Candidatus Diapherotrites archaeon CG08_land_8_20_14_0_20_30_16]